MKVKFIRKYVTTVKNKKYYVRYFTCPYCGLYQMDDNGNYLCYPCEDGKLKKPLPKYKISVYKTLSSDGLLNYPENANWKNDKQR